MEKIHFIDGFKELHFMGGMVRAEMFTLKPNPNAEPEQEDAGQLVMTPQAFVTVINSMQQLADRLIEAGVLQKNQ